LVFGQAIYDRTTPGELAQRAGRHISLRRSIFGATSSHTSFRLASVTWIEQGGQGRDESPHHH
jgi:hypothetical protein